MKSIKTCFLIIVLLSISAKVFSDPYLSKPVVYIYGDRIVIKFALYNGLDAERFHVIEEGFEVNLKFQIRLYHSSSTLLIFPSSTLVKIDEDSDRPKEEIILSKKLKYDFIEKKYSWWTYNSLTSSYKYTEAYAGTIYRNSYEILKDNYFDPFIQIEIPLRRLNISKDMDYWFEIKGIFETPEIPKTFIRSIYEFETDWQESKKFSF